MRYLVKNLVMAVELLKCSAGDKGGLIGWLFKMFIAGLAFILVTWLLFGEALHPKMIVLLPIQILTGATGG